MSILVNIQKLCKENNTSVPKLEKELGFGNGSIYNWDKSSPSVDKLQKVAKYFSVTVDSLLAEVIYVEDMKDIDEKTRERITNPNGEPYILLTPKGKNEGIPPEILEKLIKFYSN